MSTLVGLIKMWQSFDENERTFSKRFETLVAIQMRAIACS
jgi:hypothetical protein